MTRLVVIAVALSCLGLNCDKSQVFEIIPEIRLVKVEPTSIVQFQDSVVVTIEYEDGDGDLGFVEPDSFSLRVQDSRLMNPDWYFVPPLAPVGKDLPIQGELTFKLNGTYLLGSGGSEQIIYSISIKDRANNWSNTIQTPAITVSQ